MDLHPLCAAFPRIQSVVDGLASSIQLVGLLNPIVLYEGQVLDGRHRLEACELVGVEPRFEEYEGDDPLGYVWAINSIRRHLTIGQLLLTRMDMEILGWERPTAGRPAKEPRRRLTLSNPQIAERVGKSRQTVDRYEAMLREILETGTQEDLERIRQGAVIVEVVKEVRRRHPVDPPTADIRLRADDPLGLRESRLLSMPLDEGLERWMAVLELCQISAGDLRWAAHNSARHIAGDLEQVPYQLEDRWYASLATNDPDYSIYSGTEYLAEAWGCWATSSRKWLKEVERGFPLDELRQRERIADLGCGFGFTTVVLTELFPESDVFGTNLPGLQYKIGQYLGNLYGFGMAAVTHPADVVVALEYFEHFRKPLDHLRDVLISADPQYLITANSFGVRGVGHFPTYLVDGKELDGVETTRRFNLDLLDRGFTRVQTQAWNQRPTLWARV